MTAIDQLRFTVPEILSLIGLAQSVYVLVYMLRHAGDARRAVLPFLYFMVMGAAFFLDFAAGFIGGTVPHYALWSWAAWYMGPPLSVLLILQVARLTRAPDWWNFGVLLLVPAALPAARLLAAGDGDSFGDWLAITGLTAGGISLLTIWAHRGLLRGLRAEKSGRERYWLILTLVLTNILFLGTMLLALTSLLEARDAGMIRTLLGLACVYLAGTSLFRLYPQAVVTVPRRGGAEAPGLTAAERKTAARIETLLNRDKIYQEPSYTRADLARELQMPESALSRIINLHFGRSFPQLLNERRVEDAKRLLADTDAPVNVIAAEAGFNSIPSFNRVFRQLAGHTPTAWRAARPPRD